jgi:hypothetical protein
VRVTHGAEAVERTYDPLRLLTETSDAVLRALCNDVRARQVASLTDYIPATTATWNSPGWPTA